MLGNLIEKISNDFIEEALASPGLLADMAAMERYMAESYSGRVFIELLQNADDCKSKKILIKEANGNIIFANNGRRFDEKDVIAISRSGASNKKRGESIGYRGVGFKSTTYLTDEILIYSDETLFTFSKKICSEKLGIPISNIPMIRIPLLADSVGEDVFSEIKTLEDNGYTTIFVFKKAKINEFLEEVNQISNGLFIFLNNIEECRVELKSFSRSVMLQREYNGGGKLVRFLGKENDAWYIITHKNTSIGFKYDVISKKIVACDEKDQVYHSYLPTYDKMMFPIKVNADFTTDPSRKHITLDEKTEKAICSIAENIVHIINGVLDNKYEINFDCIFSIFNSYGTFSRINSVLKRYIKDSILGYMVLLLRNGDTISIEKYKLLPDWLDESEKRFLRMESSNIGHQSLSRDIYEKYRDVDQFIQNYSEQRFANKDIIDMMSEEFLVEKMLPEMQGKILGKIIKAEKIEQVTTGKRNELERIIISTKSGVKSIQEIKDNDLAITKEVQDEMKNFVSKSEISWFSKETSVEENKIVEEKDNIYNTSFKSIRKEVKPRIAKWRSAEQQCLDIEIFFGNVAVDVSKQNVGYDIESTMPNGQKRYIEVKSVTDASSFSITNNEYTAAHQYGDRYYLCLLTQKKHNIQAIYVQNPLSTLKFEKRVRQWEWYCDTYCGETFIFDN